MVTWCVGVDVVPPKQGPDHSFMAILSSPPERCFTVLIRFAGVDVFPCEQYFHHSLVSIASSTLERCSAVLIGFVGVDIVMRK